MDDYGLYFESIVGDLRQGREARKLASQLLKQWQAGIVPAPSRVGQLRKMLDRDKACVRLESDGSCAWLRKFGHLEGLAPPTPGTRVYCHRKMDGNEAERYDGCEGFSKIRE